MIALPTRPGIPPTCSVITPSPLAARFIHPRKPSPVDIFGAFVIALSNLPDTACTGEDVTKLLITSNDLGLSAGKAVSVHCLKDRVGKYSITEVTFNLNTVFELMLSNTNMIGLRNIASSEGSVDVWNI